MHFLCFNTMASKPRPHHTHTYCHYHSVHLLIITITLSNPIFNHASYVINSNNVVSDNSSLQSIIPLDCSPFQTLLHSNYLVLNSSFPSYVNLTTNCNCTYNNTNYPTLHFIANSSYNDAAEEMPINVKCGYTRGHGARIRELHMSNKNLRGNLTWLITNKKDIMNDLLHIDLSRNKFGGQIPSQVWSSMESLRYLNLSSNRLQGTIEPYAHDISSTTRNRYNNLTNSSNQLQSLDLSSNHLSGAVYMSNHNVTGFMMHLKELNVSHNEIELMNVSQSLVVRFNGISSFLPNLNCTGWCTSNSTDQHTSTAYNHSSSPSPSYHPNMPHGPVGLSHTLPAETMHERKPRFAPLGHHATIVVAVTVSVAVLVLACLALVPSLVFIRKQRASSHATFTNLSSKKKKNLTMPRSMRSKTAATLLPFYYNVPRSMHAGSSGSNFEFECAGGSSINDYASSAAVDIIPNRVIVKDPESIPVVIFHKPLLGFTFADLIQATESFKQEYEVDQAVVHGGCGASMLYYKCVLPGVLEEESAELEIRVLVNPAQRGQEHDAGQTTAATHASSDDDGSAEELLRAMGEVKHENLVPLIGYCMVGEGMKLLIYEHIEGGSLEDLLQEARDHAEVLGMARSESSEPGRCDRSNLDDWSTMDTWCPQDLLHHDGDGDHHIHEGKEDANPARRNISRLGWEARVTIGLGVARAVAYLHARGAVHGLLSAGCVMVQEMEGTEQVPPEYVAAGKAATSSEVRVRVAGYYGGGMGERYGGGGGASRSAYAAPECEGGGRRCGTPRREHGTRGTRKCTPRCDMYSMGVLMMELVCGIPSVGASTYPHPTTCLVGWVHRALKDKGFASPIDPSLPTSCHAFALQLLHMAYLCTAHSPPKRPSAQQLVGLLKDLQHANL